MLIKILTKSRENKRYYYNLLIFIINFFCLLTCSKKSELKEVKCSNHLRVISTAPSITETIFALGAESTLVGVSDYCQYPPEAKLITKIGGYFDPAYENILKIKPDIVFVLKEHKKLIDFLRENKIRTVLVSTKSVEDICSSFVIIGKELNKKEKADSLVTKINSEIIKYSLHKSKNKPTVLLCVARDRIGSGTIGTIFCAGPKTFYSQLIEIAGGRNCIEESSVDYPLLSAENIIKLSPQVIIDITSANLDIDEEKLKKDWLELYYLPAIQNNNIYVLKGDYLSIPGPRIIETLKTIRMCIYKIIKE